MGRLTTHVLDTHAGRPAAGLMVELFVLGESRIALARIVTGVEGRSAAPLLEAGDFRAGVYELIFHAGAYFHAQGLKLAEPPFLDEVILRFGVASPEEHYHVPLLLTPWSYSTYRGS